MKTLTIVAALLAAVVMFAGAAFSQTQVPDSATTQPTNKMCTGARADAPKKLEGKIVKIDHERGTLTVRTHDGKMQDFEGSRETVAEYKLGDELEATLRPQSC
ncbi:MAG TPA: hypothetical protein VMR23_01605 [Candidatus Limnocylindria bacterium]|nr:hypothetical protein [Candidatus Limnocylindria bacterium]